MPRPRAPRSIRRPASFTWTPSEGDGPGTFPVTIRVTDSAKATDETGFTITVTENNTAPVLAAISNQTVAEGALLTVPGGATDADLPAQTLTYSLVGGARRCGDQSDHRCLHLDAG